MSHLFDQQPDEHIIASVRKHWLVLLTAVLGTVLAAVAPIVLATAIVAALPSGVQAGTSLIVFGSALWVALCTIALAEIWTRYYLDIWIVTNKRIMYIEQVTLFSREITTLRIERIQDATVSFKNFIETMFNFGTLRIQSAGAVTDDLEIKGIPAPDHVKQLVLNEVDRETKERKLVSFDSRSITDEQTGA
ncbi:MAG: PH domain-containing protein [Candidatus Pacebacteria bacterium]|nr:PH domain-containing protein [Candidatus Paceibacterota bacterium]